MEKIYRVEGSPETYKYKSILSSTPHRLTWVIAKDEEYLIALYEGGAKGKFTYGV